MNVLYNKEYAAADAGRFSLPVIPGSCFIVSDGVNLGDTLQDAAGLLLDDHYQISRDSALQSLEIIPVPADTSFDAIAKPDYLIASETNIGQPGNAIFLDSVITLMKHNGKTIDALIMVEVCPKTGHFVQTHLLPMTDIAPSIPYRLIGINRQNPQKFFALIACVSFGGGTSITLANGTQRKVEDLRAGDHVLTRDNGSQEVRWVGGTTRRAVGKFAPILIKKGALNNARDLFVSPTQRLFFWQRVDLLELGRSEVMVQARHLVNDDTIRTFEGGFIDYYQILFDDHQIIYAEGIAAESMLLDPSTSPALPDEMNVQLSDVAPTQAMGSPRVYEVEKTDLHLDMADRLKRASSPR
ncbi:Hint domain-containing protein [Halocynthiibacter namhaensis]|uniref:Hint domain-containing protein n=1 Tax=Halocynthiibacter namhaensis TaxID=1290553 RepID=UPI00068CAEC6|nr:Hint domain-containing protein [Halocynthiibacter namhaensis]